MKYQVKIGEDNYKVEAPSKYEASVQAARQHAKAHPEDYPTAADVLRRQRVDVYESQEAP